MTLTDCSRFLLTTILPLTIITSQILAIQDDVCSENYPGGIKCVCLTNFPHRLYVNCSNRALTSLPTPFPDYEVIDLSTNAITEILTGPFINLTALKTLNLDRNYLQSVDSDAFSHLPSLLYLHLRYNNISHIQPGAFGRLMKLQYINLAHNYLRSVDSDVFRHLPSLGSLDLLHNNISHIQPGAFGGLMKLRWINLAHNYLRSVDSDVFRHLPSLGSLDLLHNNISHIQPCAFGGLMKLRWINLAHNYLRSVDSDVFRHLPSLGSLDLQYNLITTVDRYSFFYLPSLCQVKMFSNVLNCGCEEKFLREFMDLRNGSLSISNALCGNFGNISITDVTENSWSSLQCEGHLFRPESSRICHNCEDAKGLVDCQTHQQQQCPGSTDVCYIRQEYSDTEHLGVWSGCLDYTSCMELEANNSATCKSTTPSTCYFCNNAPKFNNSDIANTTRYFDMLALITLYMDMTDGLANNESIEYQKFVTNMDIKIQYFLYGNKGSFLVEFIDLRAPRVTIAVKITVTTMWFISNSDVKSAMQTTLKSISINSQAVETINILTYHAANPLGGSCPNPFDASLLPGVLCSGVYAECLALSPNSYTCQCVTGYYDDNGNTEGGNCRTANPLGGSCPNPSDSGLLPGVLCSGMYAECLVLSPNSYTCQCVTGYYDDNGNTEAGNCRTGEPGEENGSNIVVIVVVVVAVVLVAFTITLLTIRCVRRRRTSQLKETGLKSNTSDLNANGKQSKPTNGAQYTQFTSQMTSDEIMIWLDANNFSKCRKYFKQYTGNDLLKLTKEDFQTICGAVDGIRLYNRMQESNTGALVADPQINTDNAEKDDQYSDLDATKRDGVPYENVEMDTSHMYTSPRYPV